MVQPIGPARRTTRAWREAKKRWLRTERGREYNRQRCERQRRRKGAKVRLPGLNKAGLKALVFKLLGSICCRCGFGDERALQIDHVRGDGGGDRRLNWGASYYRAVLRSVEAGEGRYQVLCANCNWIKAVEEGAMGGTRRPLAQEA